MRQSELFTASDRVPPTDEVSVNAKLLRQAGYIDKLAAGIYTYLPLGLRVLQRIQQIVREEMVLLGAQELLMPALHPMAPWAASGRWQDPGPTVMFQFAAPGGQSYGLGWTHEEIITPLAARFIHSYRDLPVAVFQIQDKFRNEPRAKSGLLRGREFSMKDCYSFHRDAADLDAFYQRAIGAYQRVFARVGLAAVLTEASGGAFAPCSHEFQVVTPYGEDIIFRCGGCGYAQNREIAKAAARRACPQCGGSFVEEKAIEVGNIFRLGTRFSDVFHLTYLDEEGAARPVVMGCYGLGPSRVMGAIAEIHHDRHGLRWPLAVAPFTVHLVRLGREPAVAARADAAYQALTAVGVATLYDDRPGQSAGEKLNDADLLGLPWRAVVSVKTNTAIELKARGATTVALLPLEQLVRQVKA